MHWAIPILKTIKAHNIACGELDNFFQLSVYGIYSICRLTTIEENIDQVLHELKEHHESDHDLNDLRNMSILAKSEIEKGFPLLIAHTVVALWGELEALIDDVLFNMLTHFPDSLKIETLSKVKIPLAEYEMLDRDDRIRLLLTELKRSLKSSFKQGVSSFDVQLAVFNIHVSVDSNLRRVMFEMQNVRNVIVHRSSVVDRKLVDACPWMNLTVGETLQLNYDDYRRYVDSTFAYFGLLLEAFKVFVDKHQNDD